MKTRQAVCCLLASLSLAGVSVSAIASSTTDLKKINRVVLLSIDGMHALDFSNCATGLPTVNNGAPYCPNMASLGQHALNYVAASTSKPSDSFPGLLAQLTGGSPRSTGVFYDVSYDRALSPPKIDPGTGTPNTSNSCPGTKGTVVEYDEFLDTGNINGTITGRIDETINPDYLPRDPAKSCAPVYPHQFLRVNTIFEAVREAGGYTAWTDKHPAYEIVNGPSGKGLNDFYGPEINSPVAGLPGVPGCEAVVDPAPGSTSVWTDSFKNIQCYDKLHVQAVLNQIDGKTHDGKPAQVPTLFGTNFQSVSVGQKLVEKSLGQTGGYLDALGTPSDGLLSEIKFVDNSVGQIIAELKKRDLYESTLIVISAKHGQSPIDPKQVLRIPADNPSLAAPSTILGPLAAASTEDDVSLLWLADQGQTDNAVALLQANETTYGGGEIFAGKSLRLIFNDPKVDSRSPDILVTPTVGVIYTGGKKKISEHGGFAHDDTNVILLAANPKLDAETITSPVETTQIAPTILKVLGIYPGKLQAVQSEHTATLPGL